MYHILLTVHQLTDIYIVFIFGIVNNAVMNIFVQVFVSVHVFIDFGCISMSGIMLTPCLIL